MLNAWIDHGQFKQTVARPRLIEADDGNLYVVKFPPENSVKPTFSEYACGKMAKYRGLSVLDPVIINLDAKFIGKSKQLKNMNLSPGPFFATLKLDNVYSTCDPFARKINPRKIDNLAEVVDFVMFDIFVCNNDRNCGNSILVPSNGKTRFRYVLIDHGYCFDGPCWLLEGRDLPYKISHIPWKTDGVTRKSQIQNAADTMRLTGIEMDTLLAPMPGEWKLPDAEYDCLKRAIANRDKEKMMSAFNEGRSWFGGLD